MITIREEQIQDDKAVREVNLHAFGRNLEADLVAQLRHDCRDILSLVAVKQNRVVGHILFSSAIIENSEREIQEMGLAPVSVLPECQRRV